MLLKIRKYVKNNNNNKKSILNRKVWKQYSLIQMATSEAASEKMSVLTGLPCPVSVAKDSDEGEETENRHQGN